MSTIHTIENLGSLNKKKKKEIPDYMSVLGEYEVGSRRDLEQFPNGLYEKGYFWTDVQVECDEDGFQPSGDGISDRRQQRIPDQGFGNNNSKLKTPTNPLQRGKNGKITFR